MKLNRSLNLLLPLLVSILCFSCSSTKKVQKDKVLDSDSNSDVLIYIQQSPCMGKCPDYTATFYTDKRMVYEGRAHMPVIGKYAYLLPPELTKNLLFEAVKTNLKLVPDSVSIPPDVPVVRLWVVINGKMKKMVGFTSGDNQTFNNYVKFIHAEVRAMVSDQQGIKMP